MRLLTGMLRPVCVVSVLLSTLVACEQIQPRSTALEDTVGAVSFDPPPRSEAATPVVRAQTDAPSSQRDAETFYGGERRPSGGLAQAARVTGGVEVNFDGADVREVAQVILRDILGKTYTIDPQISGEVVLSSSGALSDDELLSVLETILRMHGGTLVVLGNSYAIEAIGNSQGGSDIAILGDEEPPRATPGLGFTVVPLRYVTADAAAQFVQPLVNRPEQIRVDANRNLLLFSGSNAERQTVIDTLYDIDVDWMAGRSVGIFPLSMSSPEAMIPELEALFGPLDPNGLRSETIRFLPMARLNAVLAIANQPSQIAQAKTWVSRLDRGNTVGTQFYVYQLQHVPAVDMAKLLTESISGIDVPETDSGNLPPGTVPGDPFASVPDDVPLDGFAGTTAVGGTANTALLDQVKIVPNELNNTLLIRGAPQAYDMIEATLRRLDTAPLQVLIEATIAEVTLNDQLRYGVQYFFNSGSFRGGFNTSTVTGSGVANAGLLSPLARLPGLNLVFTPGNSNITLDALSRITDLKVLSSPSLVVQDNSEAVLNVGDEVPITTRSATNVENSDSVVVNNIEYRDTGVILEVKPRISSNSMVAMDISQEVSRVATETSVQSDSLTPTIQQRKITSTINVQSGQTIVLGGLIQDSETRARDQVPLLGDIPILGNLFQNNNNQTVRTELIVIITPRIIRNAEDARDVSNELRSRMRSVSPLPPESELLEGEADPGLPQQLPAPVQPSSSAPVEPSTGAPTAAREVDEEQQIPVPTTAPDLAEGDLGAPLRHSDPIVMALSETPERPILPLPATAPVVPMTNPKRQPRVALPLPENMSDISGGVPIPSQRPVPGFQLQPEPKLQSNVPPPA